MGSYSHSAGERARPALLGHEQGGAAHRVPDARTARQSPGVDDGEDVVAEAPPAEVARGRGAVAVAPEVERPAVGLGQLGGQRRPGHAEEPGGVAEQQRRAVAAQVVERER